MSNEIHYAYEDMLHSHINNMTHEQLKHALHTMITGGSVALVQLVGAIVNKPFCNFEVK